MTDSNRGTTSVEFMLSSNKEINQECLRLLTEQIIHVLYSIHRYVQPDRSAYTNLDQYTAFGLSVYLIFDQYTNITQV